MARTRIVTPGLRSLAARLEPQMRRAFERAVAALKSNVTEQAILQALERADLTPQILAALADFPKRLEPIGRLISYTYSTAGELSASGLNRALGTTMAFDLSNPRAAAWAAQHSGSLIKDITQSTLDGVRTMLTEAMVGAENPLVTARQLFPLVKQSLGLTDRAAMAVVNYRFKLLEDGRDPADVARLAGRYTDKLLRQRSRLIARTETIRSANEGQQETWLQATEEGLLSPGETVREWITAPDERLCDFCASLNGHKAGLTEGFTSEIVPEPIIFPPLHPACRCTVGIIAA